MDQRRQADKIERRLLGFQRRDHADHRSPRLESQLPFLRDGIHPSAPKGVQIDPAANDGATVSGEQSQFDAEAAIGLRDGEEPGGEP